MDVSRKNVFGSVIWKFLERCSVQIVTFIVSIILARLLTPDDYGSIALVLVFIHIAGVFVQGGFNTALIQKEKCDSLDYSSIFYFSIFIATIIYIILFILAPYIASFYDKIELKSVMRVLGICLFFNAINSVQGAFLSKNLLFRKLFYSSFVGVSISAIIGIIMAYNGYGIWALVVQHTTSSFLVTLVMWFTVKWRPIKSFSFNRFKILFNYGWKIFTTNLIVSMFINIRSLIIGKVYNASSLAFFDRGKQFPALILDNIDSSIQSVMFPVLSDKQNDLELVKSMMRRSIKVSSYIIFPLLVGLYVLAEPLTLILLTDRWVNIVPFIQIFCIAYILLPIQNINMVAIKALGYSNISLKLELIKKVIEILILVISVFISVNAIAWGVVIYNFVCILINLYPTQKLLKYRYVEQCLDVLPPLLASLSMGVVIYVFNSLEFILIYKFILSICLGLCTYIFVSIVFKIDSLKYLIGIIKK